MTRRLIAAVVAALALAGTSAGGAQGSATAPPTEMELVEGYVESFQGFDTPAGPRTGTKGGDAAHAWFADRLADLGLRAEVQRFELPRFAVRRASLDVVGGPSPQVFPLYYSGATGSQGVTAPLVDVGAGTAREFALVDVTGKIAVIHSPWVGAKPQTLEEAMVAAIADGAVGLVAAVDGPGNDMAPPNTHHRPDAGPLPVLLIGWDDGEALRAADGVPARLVLDATIKTGSTDNTYAVVPGERDGIVIVGTPLNGWFNVASERGSGIAVLLEVARRVAARGVPSYTTVFVGHGGHEIEGGGLSRFLACFDSADVVAYLHMGATVAGRTYAEVGGSVIAAEVNEPRRALYVSENPVLAGLVADAFGPHTTGQFIRPSPGGVANPGEQADAYALGIPIVAISGNSRYFHTVSDTPDTTSQALLRPMSDAYDGLLRSILATDATTLRDANAVAASRASAPEEEHACPAPISR